MFRCFRFFLAPEVKAAGAAGGGAGGGGTAPKRRSKWIDRRSHKVRHNGKEPYSIYEQPSCALCHVRFRWKEDFLTHKQSELHMARERWAEMEKWWGTVGLPSHTRRQQDDEGLYREFLRKRASASGIAEADLALSMRRAAVNIGPMHCTGADVPAVRTEIVEPRDQRWPASPKW